jgi:hypothetical protein
VCCESFGDREHGAEVAGELGNEGFGLQREEPQRNSGTEVPRQTIGYR